MSENNRVFFLSNHAAGLSSSFRLLGQLSLYWHRGNEEVKPCVCMRGCVYVYRGICIYVRL